MNYKGHYDRLIERARGRVLDSYCECHHVVPKCMGGGNEPGNLVSLTAEEHYVAHQCLVKMHPAHYRLIYAAICMARRCTGNKAYGWLRRRKSAAQTGKKMPAGAVEKMAASKRGKRISDVHRAILLKAARLPKSTEHKAKIAASHRGMKVSPEAGKKIADANRNRVFSVETRAKMSESHKGVARGPCSPGTRAKIAAAHRARIEMATA